MATYDKRLGNVASEDSEEVLKLLRTPLKEVSLYDYNSTEDYEEAKVFGGSPNGIINFNDTPHEFAYTIYCNMQDRDWNSRHVNIAQDVVMYPTLDQKRKRMYDLVLAQLSTNDSVQTAQLAIGIMPYITSPCISAALSRQAYEESLHSESYTRMANDICKDSKRIFTLYKEDEMLFRKNASVANMYLKLYERKPDDPITVLDGFLILVANQILEELVFPGGFVAMYSLEDQMSGSALMIKEINSLSLPTERSVA